MKYDLVKLIGSALLIALVPLPGIGGVVLPAVRPNAVTAAPSTAQRVTVGSTVRATSEPIGDGALAPTATATAPVSVTATIAPSPTATASEAASASTTAQPTLDATAQPTLEVTAATEPDANATVQPEAETSATASAEDTATTAPVVVTGTVRVRLLHLREGPGATYPIRASYGRDASMEVLGSDHTRGWLRVVTADERAGWMAARNVALSQSVDELPIVDGTTDQIAAGASTSDGTVMLPPPSEVGIPATSGLDADAPVSLITDAPEGLGMIVVPATGLYVAPGVRTELVRLLHEHEQVKLFGQARGAWVRVQPFTSVVPGWVYAAHLEPLPGTIVGAPADTTALATTVTPTLATASPTRTAAPTPLVVDAQPAPPVVPTAVPPPARLPVEVVVRVVRADQPPTTRRGTTPTPSATVGVAGLRIALVDIFGDVLAEAVTPASGRVVFNRDVGADTALFVQINALGLRTRLDTPTLAQGRADVTVTLPRKP